MSYKQKHPYLAQTWYILRHIVCKKSLRGYGCDHLPLKKKVRK